MTNYHAYLVGPQMDMNLLASGPLDWVKTKADEWIASHETAEMTQLVIAQVVASTYVEKTSSQGGADDA